MHKNSSVNNIVKRTHKNIRVSTRVKGTQDQYSEQRMPMHSSKEQRKEHTGTAA